MTKEELMRQERREVHKKPSSKLRQQYILDVLKDSKGGVTVNSLLRKLNKLYREYEYNDYIENYIEFLKIIKKKKI